MKLQIIIKSIERAYNLYAEELHWILAHLNEPIDVLAIDMYPTNLRIMHVRIHRPAVCGGAISLFVDKGASNIEYELVTTKVTD